jgi:hypothetical protein
MKVSEGKECIIQHLLVGVSGSGSQVKTRQDFRVTTHDYRKIYDLYKIEHDKHWKEWVKNYKSECAKEDMLDDIFENATAEESSFKLTFNLRGSNVVDLLSSPLKIYCDVIRLSMEDRYKDFLILNLASFSAYSDNFLNNKAYSGFEATELERY